jgi:hypothetical protein
LLTVLEEEGLEEEEEFEVEEDDAEERDNEDEEDREEMTDEDKEEVVGAGNSQNRICVSSATLTNLSQQREERSRKYEEKRKVRSERRMRRKQGGLINGVIKGRKKLNRSDERVVALASRQHLPETR